VKSNRDEDIVHLDERWIKREISRPAHLPAITGEHRGIQQLLCGGWPGSMGCSRVALKSPATLGVKHRHVCLGLPNGDVEEPAVGARHGSPMAPRKHGPAFGDDADKAEHHEHSLRR
jgi:hypothetical protein